MVRQKLLAMCLVLALLLGWAAEAGAEPGKPPVRHYLAMGDSYVSKPGLVGLDPGTPTCGRSDQNYPAGVAAGLGLEPGAGFVDVSCAGAKSRALTNEQESAFGVVVPPQVDAVSEDTDLVTISIGPNDEDFMVKLVGTCLVVDLTDQEGSPCRREGPQQVPLLGEQGFASVRDMMHRDLRGAVDIIKRRAPKSRVVLVGYPQVFAVGRTCAASAPLTVGDMGWINGRVQGMNTTVQQVAKETGSTYVDVYGPSSAHSICAASLNWVAGFATADWLTTMPLHLTPPGSQEVAKIVLSTI